MATFSVNQVNQLYVATENAATVDETSRVGAIAPIADKDKKHFYFLYKGHGGVTRTDLIDIKNILYAKAVKADTMATPFKEVTVTLDDEVNEGAPVAGQDYILRIAFRQYVGMSDEDQYFKHGMVHAFAGMTVAQFYEELAVSLFRNFAKEYTPLVKFTLGGKVVSGVKNIDGKAVPVDGTGAKIAGTVAGITITEFPQEWALGIKEQVPVYFEVYPTTVIVNGDERTWGKVVDKTPKKQADGTYVPALTDSNSIHNGKKIADLEYFLMGERGDQYRSIAWPHSLETKYLVDSTKPYHLFNIHYAYVGPNEGPQKSEKDITIASTNLGILNALITEFNTATGLEVETIE